MEKLWKMVHEGSQYYDFDIDWIRETFGIEVTGLRPATTPALPPTPGKKGAGKAAASGDGEIRELPDDFFF